jgi:quinol monooxygenase YgiN
MINVIASILIHEFLDIFKSNKRTGCIEYVPTIDVDSGLPPQHLDENRVTVIEKWESLEALHAHLRAPHMLTYREQVKDMVEDLSLNVLEEA